MRNAVKLGTRLVTSLLADMDCDCDCNQSAPASIDRFTLSLCEMKDLKIETMSRVASAAAVNTRD